MQKNDNLAVNSGITVSVSTNTNTCQEMEEEQKCYKSFGGPEVNLACLDASNSSSIVPYCGSNAEERVIPRLKSNICPEQSEQSKISYHQCYNTIIEGTAER